MTKRKVKRRGLTALGVLTMLLVTMLGVSVGLAFLVPSGWRNTPVRGRSWRTDQFTWGR